MSKWAIKHPWKAKQKDARLARKSNEHQTITLAAVKGKTEVVLPRAPSEWAVAGLGWSWDTAARPFRTPLLIRGAKKLPTIQFTVLVGYQDIFVSIEDILKAVRMLANSKRMVNIIYGTHENMGPFRISDCSYQVTHRRDPDGAITRATLNMTFTRASNLELNLGPTTGEHVVEPDPHNLGTSTLSTSTTGVGGTGKGGSLGSRQYIVRRGDTFRSISFDFFSTAKYGPYIMDFNSYTRSKDLKQGDVIKIPMLLDNQASLPPGHQGR